MCNITLGKRQIFFLLPQFFLINNIDFKIFRNKLILTCCHTIKLPKFISFNKYYANKFSKMTRTQEKFLSTLEYKEMVLPSLTFIVNPTMNVRK